MDIRLRLLEHPFYQAWTKDEAPVGQLARYHRPYVGFIGRISSCWRSVIDAFSPDATGDSVIQNELDHIALWKLWGSDLPSVVNLSGLGRPITASDAIPPSRFPGALHPFNVQQPEVDQTKREGLLRHYHDPDSLLTYFDEHCYTDAHIAEAYRKYVDMHGTHHNPFLPAGFPALQKAMADDHTKAPSKRITIRNDLGDGKLVAVHPTSIVARKNRAMRRSISSVSTIIGSWRCGTAANLCR